MTIAPKFNEMVRNGEVGPIMLGRDHHDVSGTDSPFRETSNIRMVATSWQIWQYSALQVTARVV